MIQGQAEAYIHSISIIMFAKSKMQRKAAALALSVKKGEQAESGLKGASKHLFETHDREALAAMAAPRPTVKRLT